MDRVTFLVSTNPGQAPGRLEKIASGGELSRLMLALKVVLARGSPVPTLVFDEVDAGIGGATAAAVGERLARVAERLQVLVVTHSPQVAARGAQQLRVAKQVKGERAATLVEPLDRRRAARGDRADAGRRAGDGRGAGRRRQPAHGRAAVTPPRVRVRAARPEEAASVAALFNALNSMDGPPPPVAMTAEAVRRDLLGAAPKAALLVAELEGELGRLRHRRTSSTTAVRSRRRRCFLNDLYVAPEARRRGAGRALIARLAATARERGAGCLWWGVDLGDDEALLFYDAIGAEDEGGFVGRILVGPAFEALAEQGSLPP